MQNRIRLLFMLSVVGCVGVEEDGALEDELSEVEQLGGVTCTAARVLTPAFNGNGTVGVPVNLTASGTCPSGNIDYQFRVRLLPATTWTNLPGFVTPTSWTPPTAGAWRILVAVRQQGTTPWTKLSAQIAFNVAAAANQPPTANDDMPTTAKNTPIDIFPLANDTDPESNPLTLTVTSNPANGMLNVVGDQVTYTPNSEFVGSDSFTYDASDGLGGVDSATVSITVTGNSSPTATDDSAITSINSPVTVDVLANDTDPTNDPLTASLLSAPANGSATIDSSGVVTYMPNFDFLGSDSVTYQIDDGNGNTATATAQFTVATATFSCTATVTTPSNPPAGSLVNASASGSCAGGSNVEFQWYVKAGAGPFVMAQAWSTSTTYNIPTTPTPATYQVFVIVRAQGAVQADDSYGQSPTGSFTTQTATCTAPKLLTPPYPNAGGTLGNPVSLTASATCPPGVTPEFQFRVRLTPSLVWTNLPGTASATSWTPNQIGSWRILVSVRAQGATAWQANSAQVAFQVN